MRFSLLKAFIFSFTCLLFIHHSVHAQQTKANKKITGKVTFQGTPIPGVNITSKRALVTTQTNQEGIFQANVPQNDSSIVLIFTHPDFKTTQVSIGKQGLIEVEMQTTAHPFSPYQLPDHSLRHTTDILKGIQNRAAGAWITSSSGSPGAATKILLRGHRSINGNNSPLIILDGLPVNNMTIGNSVGGVDQSNRLIDISPQDIASVELVNSFSPRLLKYGLQGRNGAVIINTKKGKPNSRPVVTLYSRFTVEQINQLPALQNQYVQGLPSAGRAQHLGPQSQNQFSWGPDISNLQFSGRPNDFDKNGSLVPNGAGISPATPYNPYDFFVPGFTFGNHVSVKGGNDKKQYYFSAGRMQQNGFVPLSTFYRNSFLASFRQKMSKKLLLGGKIYFFNTHGQRTYKGPGSSSIPLGVMRTPPSFDNSNGNGLSWTAIRNFTTFTLLSDNGPRSFSRSNIENPYASVVKNPYSDRVTGHLFQFDLNWQITQDWAFSAQALSDGKNDRRSIAFDIQSLSFPVGVFNERNTTLNNFYLNTDIQYSKQFWNKLSVTANAGYWQGTQSINTKNNAASPLRLRGLFSLDNGLRVSSSGLAGQRTLQNLYLQASANYMSIVFLEAGAVNIQHSLFNNIAPINPSVSLGFDLAPLLFKKSSWINHVQLKANYSQIAGDASTYARNQDNLSLTKLGLVLGGGSTNIFYNNTADKASLKPELTTVMDFGVSLVALKRRLQFRANHYQTTNQDQIIAGPNSLLINGGTITNQGWEYQLSGDIISNPAFSWTMSLNLTRFQSKVGALPRDVERINLGGLPQVYSSATNGQPYGAIYGTNFQRSNNGQLVIGNQGFPTFGILGIVSDPTPEWLWGLESNIRWKGLQIGTRWDVRRGGDIWNGTLANLDYYGNSKRSGDQRSITNFVYPGIKLDGTINHTPINFYNPNIAAIGDISPFTAYGENGTTEANIQDGSWIRLREIIVSYTVSSKWLENWLISELTISFIGRNLLLITDYTGVDPETNLTGDSNAFGFDYFNMPQTKSLGGAITIRF